MGGLTWRSTWLGWTRTITHVCADHEPSIHYLLLYDEAMNFVGIIPGADRFIESCGQRVYFSSETEDIELIDGG